MQMARRSSSLLALLLVADRQRAMQVRELIVFRRQMFGRIFAILHTAFVVILPWFRDSRVAMMKAPRHFMNRELY